MAKNPTHTASKAAPDATRPSRPRSAASSRPRKAESLKGFVPRDKSKPAPDRLPSALKAFGGLPKMDPDTEVDPMAALTEQEREEHHKELAGIVQAQRHAESLVGVSMRP